MFIISLTVQTGILGIRLRRILQRKTNHIKTSKLFLTIFIMLHCGQILKTPFVLLLLAIYRVLWMISAGILGTTGAYNVIVRFGHVQQKRKEAFTR